MVKGKAPYMVRAKVQERMELGQAWGLLLPESEAGQSWSPLRLPLGSRAASRLLHSSHQKQVTEAGCHSGRGDLGSAFNGTSVTVLAELLPSEHP